MPTSEVCFLCNCGQEITIASVKAEEEYTVVCQKCGQDYRFTGATVLRFGTISTP